MSERPPPGLRVPWALVAGLLVGLPYLGGGPVWDDHELILGRLVALDAHGLAALWTGAVGQGAVGAGYLRPVSLTLLALVGRLGVPAVHLLAAVLHGGSAELLRRIVGPGPAGLAAGLVLALHPVVAEVLGWASALPDALAVHLALWAALLLGRNALLAGILGVLAILSKESAYVLLPVLAWAVGAARGGRLAVGGAVAVGLGLRMVLGVGAVGGGAVRPLLALEGLVHGLGLLVWPVSLSAVRDLRAADPGLQGLGLGVLVALLVVGARRPAARPGVLLAVGAVAVALPTVMDGYLFGERYVYAAVPGLALVIARVLGESRSAMQGSSAMEGSAAGEQGQVGRGGRLALAGLVLVGALSHVLRASDWRSDLALFTAAVEARPGDSSAWHLLGKVHERAADPASAAEAYRAAVQRGFPYPTDFRDVVVMEVLAGNHEAAFRWAESGPTDGLRAEDLAWWARAAHGAGATDRARELLVLLRTGEGWAGPDWVPALARELALEQRPAP